MLHMLSREEHLGKGKCLYFHILITPVSTIIDMQLYSENAKIKVNAIGMKFTSNQIL